MNCPACGAASSDEKKYCGDCGASLIAARTVSQADLRRQLEVILKEQPKDPKLLEVELTEAVVGRISNWAKLLGYFAGIPLGLLIVVIGALGFKKYADLQTLADRVDKIKPIMEQAQKDAEKAQKDLAELDPKMAKIRTDSARFDSYDKELSERFAAFAKSLDAKVASINNDVNQIAEVVSKPAIFRWPVRTGTDPDARLVAPTDNPVATTVEAMVALSRPADLMPPNRENSAYQAKRARPVELTVYSLEATLLAVKHEVSGDYHLVLMGTSGAEMVARAPNPDPEFVAPSSHWVKEIAAVRHEIDGRIQGKSAGQLKVRVRIAGVGFFNRAHGVTGEAANAIELDPVTSIKFLE